MRLSARQTLGLAGSALMLLGVWAPLVRIPFGGSPNLFALYAQRGDVGWLWTGVAFGLLAAVSLAASLLRRYRWLWLTGGGGLASWLVAYLNFRSAMEHAAAGLQVELAHNPLRGLAQSMLQGVELQWGAYALLAAALVWLFTALGAGLQRSS